MAKLTDMKTEDLKKLLAEKQAGLRNFRFGVAGSKSRNTHEGRNTRKDIARILTELNARSLSHAKK